MNRAYVICPIVLTLGFAGYAFWYSSEKEKAEVRADDRARRARHAAVESAFGGTEFVGRDGKKEAEDDILRGVPKLLFYGKTTAHLSETKIILKQRFGIEVDSLAGCIVNEPLVAFAGSYNAAIRKYIDAKFGPTAFEEAEHEALQTWEVRRNGKSG